MAFSLGIENFSMDAGVTVANNTLANIVASIESLNEDQQRLDSLVADIAKFDEGMNNLVELERVISTEGMSAGLMALFNNDGALATLIQREIPALTEENVKEVSQICVEGLGEKKKSMGEAIKDFFIKMIKYVKDFVKSMMDSSLRMASSIGSMKKKIAERTTNEEDFKKAEAKVFSKAKFNEVYHANSVIFNKFKSYPNFKVEDIAPQLKTLGYRIVEGKVKKDSDSKALVVEKAVALGSIGWAPNFVTANLDDVITMLKRGKEFAKIEADFAAEIKRNIAYIDTMERGGSDEAKIKDLKDKVEAGKKKAVLISQLLSICGATTRILGSQTLTLGSKVISTGKKK